MHVVTRPELMPDALCEHEQGFISLKLPDEHHMPERNTCENVN